MNMIVIVRVLAFTETPKWPWMILLQTPLLPVEMGCDYGDLAGQLLSHLNLMSDLRVVVCSAHV